MHFFFTEFLGKTFRCLSQTNYFSIWWSTTPFSLMCRSTMLLLSLSTC